MLKTIIRHITRMLRALLAAPGDILRSLFGGGAAAMPTPEFEEVVDEQVEELRERLDRKPETPLAGQSLGELVHAYAVGDQAARESFDLGRIPDHVSLALLAMAPSDLAKLAAATPDQCGRWSLGKRSGIVGLPSPVPERQPAAAVRVKRRDGEQEPQPALVPECERHEAVRLALAA